jgi:Ca-activated chloride channel homolog
MKNSSAKLHLSTSEKYLPVDQPSVIHLMMQIKQPSVELGADRRPINTAFVLDRSGSMQGPKLTYAKEAVKFAVKNLEPVDTVALVIFDDIIEVLVPATPAEHKDQIISLINNVQAGGSTNLSGGLFAGVEEVRKNFDREKINRVVILTDGLANVGITDHDRLKEMVRDICTSGIVVTTMGVGHDFDEDLLVDLAEAGNGNFYYIDSPEKLPAIFEQELSGLLSVTGQNPTLTIKPAAGIHLNAVFGYQPEPVTGGVMIRLPDIYSGDTKTVLAELQIKPLKAGLQPVVAIEFKYTDVTAELAAVSISVELSIEATNDPGLLTSSADLQVKKEVELFRAAEAREESMRLADQGDYDASQQVLFQAKQNIKNLNADMKDNELFAEMSMLDVEAENLRPDSYTPANRKAMKDASFQRRKKR